jgi:hypothetical protein
LFPVLLHALLAAIAAVVVVVVAIRKMVLCARTSFSYVLLSILTLHGSLTPLDEALG